MAERALSVEGMSQRVRVRVRVRVVWRLRMDRRGRVIDGAARRKRALSLLGERPRHGYVAKGAGTTCDDVEDCYRSSTSACFCNACVRFLPPWLWLAPLTPLLSLENCERMPPAKRERGDDESELEEVFTWSTREAIQVAHSQSGASNCGATALLNVLSALRVSVPRIGEAERAVHTNARKYGVSASEYLQARSVAGCTGEDIVAGCRQVAGEEVASSLRPT